MMAPPTMPAAATKSALEDAGLSIGQLGHLATATTQGDYIVPGHASAVHAELGAGPIEIASYQSVCASALMAAKGAWLQVRTGEADVAAAAAGEFSSRWFRPEFYEGTALVDVRGRARVEADFLRFTLSDGAGAVVMEPRPRPDGPSLKVEWIDLISLAGRFDPCMWAGSTFADRADMKSAWSHAGPVAAHAAGSVALVQEEIVSVLKSTAAMIPEEKWFSNLPSVGNIGAASIWVMLDEFMKSGRARTGEKVLLIVPESGRAMVGFMMCEVV